MVEEKKTLTNEVSAKNLNGVGRWMIAAVAVTCVGLAALGVILPGMPTTIFLVVACFLFARSHPHLEKLLVRNRFFARFLPLVDGHVRLSPLAKGSLLALIWISTAISCTTLYLAGVLGFWPIVGIVVLNALGSIFIAKS